MKVTAIAVSIDESDCSINALKWALGRFSKAAPGVQLHLLTVMPPIAYTVYPVAPVATAASVAAVTNQWESQKRHDEHAAHELLAKATAMCEEFGVPKESIHSHALPAAGGASGVAESIVEFTKVRHVDLLVVGCRGLGSFKRSLMSMVGLGSVSDYCIHNVACPVVVVRADTPAAQKVGEPSVCIATDDSSHSNYALVWALENIVKPEDDLHVITVSPPVPYPILDETSAAVAALETQQWQQRSEDSAVHACKVARRAEAEALKHGVAPGRLHARTLSPTGGASDVGASICTYTSQHHVDLVVVGSRGMGSLQRSLMSFMGLGSVSDYLVHNLHSAVAVVKSGPGVQNGAGNGTSATAGAEQAATGQEAPAAAAEAEPKDVAAAQTGQQ